MITRRDLLEAIEKCQGQKNPNANTCVKLAAYYVILDHTPEDESELSFTNRPSSEFMSILNTKKMDDVLIVIDDLMEDLQGVNPKLYYKTMERLSRL